MPRTIRGAAKLAFLTAILLAATTTQAATAQVVVAALPAADGTVPLPAVAVSDVTVLGPCTARVTATVDNRNLDSTLHLSYGEGSLLNQRTPDVQVNAGLKPNEVIIDLVDLKPGSSYDLQAILGSPLGTFSRRLLRSLR